MAPHFFRGVASAVGTSIALTGDLEGPQPDCLCSGSQSVAVTMRPRRRLVVAATAATLVLAMVLPAAPVGAWDHTELYVSPADQNSDGCPTVAAAWTVNAMGGNPAYLFNVSVYYGDGDHRGPTSVPGTSYWSHTFHGVYCPIPHVYTQSWSASRGGGGTAYDTTSVHAN